MSNAAVKTQPCVLSGRARTALVKLQRCVVDRDRVRIMHINAVLAGAAGATWYLSRQRG